MKLKRLLLVCLFSMQHNAGAASSNDEPVMLTVTQAQQEVAANSVSSLSPEKKRSTFEAQRVTEHVNLSHSDVWIYDSWVTLRRDNDYDGFYSSLSLSFDVDTIYDGYTMYTVIYLGDATQYEPVYVTSTFSVFGESSTDYLTLEIDLVSGYAPFDYDIRIEVYDASNDHRIAVYDAFDDTDLSLVSLESATNDNPYSHQHSSSTDKHAGTSSLPAIFLVAIFALATRRVRLSL